jgi:hypothetical protein
MGWGCSDTSDPLRRGLFKIVVAEYVEIHLTIMAIDHLLQKYTTEVERNYQPMKQRKYRLYHLYTLLPPTNV